MIKEHELDEWFLGLKYNDKIALYENQTECGVYKKINCIISCLNCYKKQEVNLNNWRNGTIFVCRHCGKNRFEKT
jgi:hypothetical protein